MQLDKKIRQANNLRKTSRTQTDARKLSLRPPPTTAQKTRRRGWDRSRRRARGAAWKASRIGRARVTRGSQVILAAIELRLSEGLDPSGKVAESLREEGESLHREALAVSGEGHEGVNAAAAAGVRVWDAEDVGCCVACLGVAEEDGARGGG